MEALNRSNENYEGREVLIHASFSIWSSCLAQSSLVGWVKREICLQILFIIKVEIYQFWKVYFFICIKFQKIYYVWHYVKQHKDSSILNNVNTCADLPIPCNLPLVTTLGKDWGQNIKFDY